MKDWFENLESRERLFVSAGGVIAVVALFYAFIWLPLDNGQKTLAGDIATWERSLAELRPLKNLAGQPGASTRPQNTRQQTPVVIVDQSLRARGLDRSLKRSQPTTSNGIRVEFENVAFDDLVLWLGDLSAQYAMQVSAGSFSAANQSEPGRINATLTLERTP